MHHELLILKRGKNTCGVHVDPQDVSLSAMARTGMAYIRLFLRPKKAGNIIYACAKRPGISLIATDHIIANRARTDSNRN